MPNIVGVQFKGVGKIYYFDPQNIDFKVGDKVIVETVRGIEMGRVIFPNREVHNEALEHELKTVIRKATHEDETAYEYNLKLAEKSLETFKRLVFKSNLPMKPLDCEYTIDRSKVLFYYSSEERVDFRDLLKELASEFKVRIELRQVGAREAARFVGGLGYCGREVCCKSHLREFDLVTMKMAKDQTMSLNASKIGGVCGKLMCCIAYENQMYQELREEVPGVGELVKTPKCERCKVINVDYIRKMLKTDENGEGMPAVYASKEVERLDKNRKNNNDTEDLKVENE